MHSSGEGPYAQGASSYVERGWPPIPVKGKAHPPRGFTGWEGALASVPDVYAWCDGEEAQHNLALRLPPGFVGIDVDAHSGKAGYTTWVDAQLAFGPLPNTWSLTSRGANQPSRIHLYRAPEGAHFGEAQKRIREKFGPDVDIIHFGHRYALAWPSIHPETGMVYRWHTPDGLISTEIPRPEDLAELPPAWLDFLSSEKQESTFADLPEPSPDRFSQLVPVGSRSNEARDFTWKLAHAGLPLEVARGAAHRWWQLFVEQPAGDPFPFEEVDKALANAYKKASAPGIVVSDSEDLRVAIEAEKQAQRVRRAARRELDEEEAEKKLRTPPTTMNLTDALSRPREPLTFTIESLLPKGGNAMLAAKYKAGKTTIGGNLLRCLADGTPFLGRYAVAHPPKAIGYWNYEVSEAQFLAWLEQIGIENTDNVHILNLRGFRVPLTSPSGERWLTRWLKDRGVDFLIVDPFARAYSGSGAENSNDDVGVWLDTLDVVKERASVSDLVLMHHFGRGEEERARGASRLDDWPDARWLLTTDEDGNRFFSAHGRDVDVAEFKLEMSPETRALVGTDGSRKTTKLTSEVLEFLAENPGATSRQLIAGIPGRNGDISEAVEKLVHDGLVRIEHGPRNAKLHHLAAAPFPTVPDCSPVFPGTVSVTVPRSPSLGRGTVTQSIGSAQAEEPPGTVVAPETVVDPEQALNERHRAGEGCGECGAKPVMPIYEPYFVLACMEHSPYRRK